MTAMPGSTKHTGRTCRFADVAVGNISPRLIATYLLSMVEQKLEHLVFFHVMVIVMLG